MHSYPMKAFFLFLLALANVAVTEGVLSTYTQRLVTEGVLSTLTHKLALRALSMSHGQHFTHFGSIPGTGTPAGTLKDREGLPLPEYYATVLKMMLPKVTDQTRLEKLHKVGQNGKPGADKILRNADGLPLNSVEKDVVDRVFGSPNPDRVFRIFAEHDKDD